MCTRYLSHIFSLLLFFTFVFFSTNLFSSTLPVLDNITKWQTEETVPITTEKSTIIAQTVSSVESSPVILGTAYDITETKSKTNPVVTAATTSRLEQKISSRCAIIIDAKTGKTLFARNPNSPRQPASTIKILTGMIAIKSLADSESVSVSRKAARQPRSKIYLDQRKVYKADDLINAVLLASANDASVALAEKIAGDEKQFAEMMTLRAKLWGAQHTVCKTATGLTAKGQTSTARDLATIFRHAMNDEEFSERMKRVKARTTDGQLLRNHNKALWQVEGTLGGKTGYTNAARQTYVGKFKRGKNEIIVAIMGSETMWADIKRLVEYGFKKQIAMSDELDTLTKDTEMVAEL
ncbi:MAG: serine hydrolase [Proteobacteria bacterium]|nr:serine hydrolase [Pseudomonadota bacterium]MBU1234901.1 serine hydrolase [Pseudomonadota bacterium]MBU1420624.1 serine hydrolase [Pseudomonadota bacterium]MBU1455501.1 serine hydrolase [Pseudomonadota bacterium]